MSCKGFFSISTTLNFILIPTKNFKNEKKKQKNVTLWAQKLLKMTI